ncbi:MAG: hypothetical protein AB1713_08715 [Pseudomonadota bacterium]
MKTALRGGKRPTSAGLAPRIGRGHNGPLDNPGNFSTAYTGYRKLGFRNMPGLVVEGVPPEDFLGMSFDGHIPQGTVMFHEAFKAEGLQEGTSEV